MSRSGAARAHDDDSKITKLRVPPQSVEDEQAVLGGLMLDPGDYRTVKGKQAMTKRSVPQ